MNKKYDQISKDELLEELKQSEKKLNIDVTQIINSTQEKKITRTFSLTDSELQKFERLALDYGYRNRSQFLQYLIKKL